MQVLGSSALPSVPHRREASSKPAGPDPTATAAGSAAAAAASGSAPLDLLSGGDWDTPTAAPAAAPAASQADGTADGQCKGEDRGSRSQGQKGGKGRDQQQQRQQQQPVGWASFDDDVTADGSSISVDANSSGGSNTSHVSPCRVEKTEAQRTMDASKSGGDKWHPLMHIGGGVGEMAEQAAGEGDGSRQSVPSNVSPEGAVILGGGEGSGKEAQSQVEAEGGVPGGGQSLVGVLSEWLKGRPERIAAVAFARLVESQVGRSKDKVRQGS